MSDEREPLWIPTPDEIAALRRVLEQQDARITELEAEARHWRQQHAECTTSLITEVRKTERLEAQLAQTWQPLPDGEVFDTITRSLVSSESINDTHTWMRRVDAATKWINALRGKE